MVLDLEHPAEQTLRAYGLGSLSDTDSSAVEQHITDCERCRRVVEDAPPDSLMGLLRASMSRPADDATAADAASVMTPEPSSTASTMDSHPPLYKRVAQLLGDTSAATSAKTPVSAVTPPPGLADHARYQILDHLGSGGMGTVFKAQHRLMNRAVAIKVINPALLNKPSVKERFLREVKAAASLAHCNIVTAHDAEQSGDLHLLVMEFVQGETLADRIRREGGLPVAVACQLIREAATGLQHAHERGMVHRDIKPANIMIETGGRAKLMDFGLACFHSESNSVEGITELGAIMGTPDYMAPEQALDPHTADIRADIYSLGCTLYHALAGQVPYPATTPLAKIDAHRAGRGTPVKTFRTDVPAELSAVVERMMAKDPGKRFQTPAAVAEALLSFTQAKPTTAQVRRRRFPVIAAAILLAFVPLAYFFGPTVFRFVTNQGVLVVETTDKDIKITAIQDSGVVKVLDLKTGAELVLSAGKYKLQLDAAKAGGHIKPEEVTLSRGGKEVVRVRWEPAKEVVGTPEKRSDPPAPETAASLRKLISEAMAKQDYAACAEAAEKLIRVAPGDDRGSYVRGWALLMQGKRAESIADFTRVLSMDPDHRDALAQRSFAYLNTDQFDLCIADCDRLLKLGPKGYFALAALNNRGGAWALKGRFDKGYADFDASFKMDSENAVALIWKGIILKRMGDETKGKIEIDKALRLDPNLKDYGFNRLDHVAPQPPPLDEWLQGREILTVSQDGKAKYKTIGAALDALKPGQVVRILDKGPYREDLNKELPENVGIISDVGTRIEPPQWSKLAPTPGNPKTFTCDAWRIRCPRNLRLHGLEVVGPKADAENGFGVIINMAVDGDTVVESCRIYFDDSERQNPPRPGMKLPFGRIDFTSWSNQPGRLWVRDSFLGRHVLVSRPGASVVFERNHIVDPPNEAFHIWANDRPREVILRHNVIQALMGIKFDGTKVDPEAWVGVPVSIFNNYIEVTSFPIWFSHRDDEKRWTPRNVRIQNNVIHSAEHRGVMLTGKGMSEVRDSWRVSHNSYAHEPGGVGHMQTFNRGPTDKIEPKPFMSSDPKHEDYLRTSPKNPLATGGAGGDLPNYIGPFPPGPAPKTGDWFTRLASRESTPLVTKALDSLQGDWLLASRQTNGEKPSDETAKNYRLTIKGDQWILNPGPTATIKIDASKNPKWLDVGKYSPGIYKLEGDTLTICRLTDASATERPIDFKTTKDDLKVVIVYKRLRQVDADNLLAQARAALLNNDYQAAILAVDKALTLDPKLVEGYFLRADVLLKQGKRAEAIPDLTKVLSLKPNDSTALSHRSFAYLNANQLDLCIADCDTLLIKVFSQGPHAVVAYNNRGGAWALKGRFDKSYFDFEAASQLDPKDPMAPIWKGILLKRLGDEAKAKIEIDKGLTLAPHMKDYGFNRLDHVVPEMMPLEEWLKGGRKGRKVITVAQDGRGQHRTIQDALDAVKDGEVIKVLDKGPYKERLHSKARVDRIGLISEVGTRVEIPQWLTLKGTDPKKPHYVGWSFDCFIGFRMSGFEIVAPKIPEDAGQSTTISINTAGLVYISSCQVKTQPQDVPSRSDFAKLVDHRALLLHKDGTFSTGLVVVEDNRFEGQVVTNLVAPTVFRRNHMIGSQSGLWLPQQGGPTDIRHNVIQGFNGITFPFRTPENPDAPGACYLVVNNMIDATFSPILVEPTSNPVQPATAPPSRVRIHNNILRSGHDFGIWLTRKDLDKTKSKWGVSHNLYVREPAAQHADFAMFPRQSSDLVTNPGFLSENASDRNYLRLGAGGPLGSAGAGGYFEKYIGPFPPGPAPKEGDWFTRLRIPQ